MTNEEHKRQLHIAKANLRLIQRQHQDGIATKKQLDEAEQILANLRAYQVPNEPPKAQKAAFEVPQSSFSTTTTQAPELTESVKSLLDSLIKKRDEAHAKKATLSNQLHTIPEHENCPDIVSEILALRNVWKEYNSKIKFIQQNGCLPESQETPVESKGIDESEFLKAIEVKELWAISQDIDNCRSNLSKARKQLKNVSDPLRQLHYQRKIAELEWKLSQLLTVFNAKK
ncbi:hypothetical protein [Flectobacillus roseus]|uniref:hypothetical protein n=1 Tax=Flectobacillus roseus TaxID=502259 RepID=UPI0024B682C1|nr:hypothetical protein [Flectobacillus roseus]MDI9871320.1 hypothetical protein [Flectobacillus roseus]